MRATNQNNATKTNKAATTNGKGLRQARKTRRGAVLIYAMTGMAAFVGFCSLAVDWGRVQLVKTELQSAADASARAGAGGLAVGPDEAVRRAKYIALQNKADGAAVDLTKEKIELGWWDTDAAQFTVLADTRKANAVRVVARRAADKGDAVPLSFAKIFGKNSKDVGGAAVAMLVPAVDVNQKVLATANPFLAGMPAGTLASPNNPHNSPDFAGYPGTSTPRQSPEAVNLPLKEGQKLTFDSIDGLARHDPNLAYYNPDGQMDDISHNTAGSEHGIADVTAPINALVGLFLGDDQPDKTTTPKSLDFSTEKSRDFDTLSPQIKQIFFIGDGLNSKNKQQEFVVPKGATRLFLATWDFYEWNNNFGSRTVKVARPEQIILVK